MWGQGNAPRRAEDVIIFLHPIALGPQWDGLEFHQRDGRRDVRIMGQDISIVFDGAIVKPDTFKVIEVKYVRNVFARTSFLKEILKRFAMQIERIGSKMPKNFSVIFAIATDEPVKEQKELITRLHDIMPCFSFPFEIRMFNLNELQRDLAP